MKKIWMPAIVALMVLTSLFSVTSCSSGAGAQGPAGPAGAAGLSISSATVNASGHLILTMSNGQTIDAGYVVGPAGAAGTATGPGSGDSFASVIAQIEPKIVRIDCTVTGGLDSGSGTIVDARGYILTNAHVVAGATAIKVTIKDGTIFAATVVHSDTAQDMAIIKLTTTRTDFPVITLGTSADFALGDEIVAGGFPMGTSLPGPATFTQGIVSALRTYPNNAGTPQSWIQIDVPVNPGNSGGCLFTETGKMIGIPSAGIDDGSDFEDINLAIPVSLITPFVAAWVGK
jgi:serine protease Do